MDAVIFTRLRQPPSIGSEWQHRQDSEVQPFLIGKKMSSFVHKTIGKCPFGRSDFALFKFGFETSRKTKATQSV
jgi:hypothetical protein